MHPDQAVRYGGGAALAPAVSRPRTVGELVLRRARPGDAATLAGLERAIFPTLWPRTNFRREIQRSGHLVLLATADGGGPAPPHGIEKAAGVTDQGPRASAGPFARALQTLRSLVIPAPGDDEELTGAPAGYVTVWFVAGEAHVAAIGVRPEARGHGVGELLLLGAIEAAADRGCDTVTLEVRRSNEAARALYRKYGFQETGLRKRYYVDNGEDAVIMTTPRITDRAYAEKLARLSRQHAARSAFPADDAGTGTR